MRNVVASLLLLGMALGCNPAAKQTTSSFAGPTGMAVAGSQFNYVFVANAGVDAIQVVNVTPALKNVDMVPGPVRYFPLYIPAGPNPSELAATVDGRFVVVLDLVTGSLRLIDADKLTLVRDSTGEPIELPLGPSSAQPAGMVGASVACTDDGCLGRFYITLRGTGSVAVVDVLQGSPSTAPTLNVTEVIVVGDEPLRIATVPGQDVFFVTDAVRPVVKRVDRRLPQGTFIVPDTINLGARGGPIAVSGDGTLLVVGRPDLRDVVLLSNDARTGLDGNLSFVDADPVWTPTPECLQTCNEGGCAAAHPSDAALCSYGPGVSTSGASYGALYVGNIPSQLGAVSATASAPILGGCSTPGGTQPVFTQGVAVANLDGSVYFIALRDVEGKLTPQLVPTDSCAPPYVSSPDVQVAPSAFLDQCPESPDRQRFACLKDRANQGVVTLARGQLTSQVTWTFAWESVLPNLDRSQGGGQILPDGRFTDPALLGLNGDVRPGDTLQLTSAVPLGSEECARFAVGGCAEVVIDAVDNTSGSMVLTTTPSIPPACYESTPVVSYRIRAGHAFMVSSIDATGAQYSAPARLPLSQLYGLAQAGPASVLMKTKGLTEAPTTLSRCEVYNSDGSLRQGVNQEALLNRRDVYSMSVYDPYAAVRKGLQYDATNTITGTLGKLPGGMVVTRGPNPLLFVSFAGADMVLVSNPLNAVSALIDDTNNMILQ